MDILSIQHLNLMNKGKLLIHDLSLEIKSNQVWGILGPNGVGKTSLLHTIASLNDSTQKHIILNQHPLSTYSYQERARMIALLQQEPEFIFSEKVIDILKLVFYGKNTEDKQFVNQILSEFGLDHLQDKLIHDLSSGERKRVAMAMVKLQKTKILILDEPTNHLDVQYQYALIKCLITADKIIIFSTHDLNLIEYFCSHVLMLLPNGQWLAGTKEQMMTETKLSRLYQQDLFHVQKESRKVWGVS